MTDKNLKIDNDITYVKVPKTIINIIGNTYGRLTVIGYIGIKNKNNTWYCQCDCGNTKLIKAAHLNNGNTKSCGCLKGVMHGMSKTSIYRIWKGVKQRCFNVNNPAYSEYGGRGITMSKEWKDSFITFYNDMGKRPSKNYSIDRINNNGDYCKENCKWATKKEQNNNRRDNYLIEYKGNNISLADYCSLMNLNYGTIRSRINRGWSLKKSLNTPIRARKIKYCNFS